MKKTKGALFLLLISLTSCEIGSGGNFSWSKYENDEVSMSLQSSKFKNYKLASVTQEDLQKLMDDIEDIVETNGNTTNFIKYFTSLNSKIYKIVDSYIIASTKYYANADKEYKTLADSYFSMYTSVVTFELGIESKIAQSSQAIKQAYFGDMTDEQIQDYIKDNEKHILETEYTEILKKYTDEGNELYMQLNRNAITVDEYMDKGYDYIMRYTAKANEFVEKAGYTSFFEYSYPNEYNRDYSINDAMTFVDYVKEYFVPVYKNKKSLTTPSVVDQSLLNALSHYNFCNSTVGGAHLFQSYAEELGGNYLSCYNKAFKNGYYCFSDSSYSMSTAYQWGLFGADDSVLYFSRNYQSILTIIHEFGHYYSSHVNGGARNNDSHDLLETYSQADEFTFLNYLREQKKEDEKADTYNYYADSEYYSQLSSIINDACITEIENFVFSNPFLSKTAVKRGVEEIVASYDGTASTTYFMVALITNPLYYISYSTSVMEAIQFLDMSFEDAKSNYATLVESTKNMTMVERWENAGLMSPFKEDTFKKLATSFSTIAEKY